MKFSPRLLFLPHCFAVALLLMTASCSSVAQKEQPASTVRSTIQQTPHLADGGACASSDGGGRKHVIVNPNRHYTLRVFWIRQYPDQGTSITQQSDVAPGQSAFIGCDRMDGKRCTYEITGWMDRDSLKR